ncbi:MAG: GNAT family N-acetyltransferase [Planctomycetes bacterium]|nr:GNAT family N-acetyltransferase [Planctomycetota bacterium]
MPRVCEFLPRPLTPQESRIFAERIEAHFEARGFGLWAVETLGAGAFAGFVGLTVPRFEAPFTPCVEIGWRLLPEHWGCGYATEAARAAITFGFRDLGLGEILSFTVPANHRSRAVMERIGMREDKEGAFAHPALPAEDRLSWHRLYRIAPDQAMPENATPLFGERLRVAVTSTAPAPTRSCAMRADAWPSCGPPGGSISPGGGSQGRETAAETVVRESVEECGLHVAPGALLGWADQYLRSALDGKDYRKCSTFLRARVLEAVAPSERDHTLRWLDPEEATRTLSHESHRWAVARAR